MGNILKIIFLNRKTTVVELQHICLCFSKNTQKPGINGQFFVKIGNLWGINKFATFARNSKIWDFSRYFAIANF